MPAIEKQDLALGLTRTPKNQQLIDRDIVNVIGMSCSSVLWRLGWWGRGGGRGRKGG